MKRTKTSTGTSPIQDNGVRISFILGDKESMRDMLVTLCRGDLVSGQFRMDFSHWPFQSERLYRGRTWMKVIDILYELGCWLEEDERRRTESQLE